MNREEASRSSHGWAPSLWPQGGDAARRALEVILHNGMDAWVYSGKDWLVRDPNAPHVAREQWTVKFAPTVVENFDGVLDSAVKIVGVSDDHDLVARCEKDARDALGTGARQPDDQVGMQCQRVLRRGRRRRVAPIPPPSTRALEFVVGALRVKHIVVPRGSPYPDPSPDSEPPVLRGSVVGVKPPRSRCPRNGALDPIPTSPRSRGCKHKNCNCLPRA